jgi:hypothetical protein
MFVNGSSPPFLCLPAEIIVTIGLVATIGVSRLD